MWLRVGTRSRAYVTAEAREVLPSALHLSIRIRTPSRITPETLLNMNLREASVGFIGRLCFLRVRGFETFLSQNFILPLAATRSHLAYLASSLFTVIAHALNP